MEVRFDWLTFTVPSDSFERINDLVYDVFGLEYELFVPCRGRYGYQKGMFHENITILTDGGRDFMGVCFEISGKGCSYLYFLDGFDFKDIFKKINSFGGNISRLDVALDCFDNELDYDVIRDEIAKHNYCSKWRKARVITSYGVNGIGFDAEFGSRRSDIMLRIYDKKVESGSDRDYWCRLELQFRHDLAYGFADTYLNEDEYTFFDKFAGVLSYYLRFIDRIYVKDTDKCPTLPWWDEFLEKITSRKCNFTT